MCAAGRRVAQIHARRSLAGALSQWRGHIFISRSTQSTKLRAVYLVARAEFGVQRAASLLRLRGRKVVLAAFLRWKHVHHIDSQIESLRTSAAAMIAASAAAQRRTEASEAARSVLRRACVRRRGRMLSRGWRRWTETTWQMRTEDTRCGSGAHAMYVAVRTVQRQRVWRRFHAWHCRTVEWRARGALVGEQREAETTAAAARDIVRECGAQLIAGIARKRGEQRLRTGWVQWRSRTFVMQPLLARRAAGVRRVAARHRLRGLREGYRRWCMAVLSEAVDTVVVRSCAALTSERSANAVLRRRWAARVGGVLGRVLRWVALRIRGRTLHRGFSTWRREVSLVAMLELGAQADRVAIELRRAHVGKLEAVALEVVAAQEEQAVLREEGLSEVQRLHALELAEVRRVHGVAMHDAMQQCREVMVQRSAVQGVAEQVHNETRQAVVLRQLRSSVHRRLVGGAVQRWRLVTLQHSAYEATAAYALAEAGALHCAALSEAAKRHAEAIAALQTENDAALRAMAERAKASTTVLETDAADEAVAIQAEKDYQIRKMEGRHAETMAEVTAEHATTVSGMEEEIALSEAHKAELVRTHLDALRTVEAEAAASVLSSEQEHARILVDLRSEQETALEEAGARAAVQLEFAESAVEGAAAAATEKAEAVLRLEQGAHAVKLEQIVTAHEYAMVRMEADHAAARDEATSGAADEVAALHERQAEHLEQIKLTHADEVLRFEAEHAAGLGEAKKVLDAARVELEAKAAAQEVIHCAAVAEAVTEAVTQAVMEVEAGHATALETLAAKTCDELAHAKAMHAHDIAKAVNTFEAAQGEHAVATQRAATEVQCLVLEHAEVLRRAAIDAEERSLSLVEASQEAHAAALEDLHGTHMAALEIAAEEAIESTLEEVQVSHEREIEGLEMANDELRADLEGAQRDVELGARRLVEAQGNLEHASLLQARTEARAEVAQLAEVDAAKVEEAHVAELDDAFEIIKEESIALDKVKDELAAVTEEYMAARLDMDTSQALHQDLQQQLAQLTQAAADNTDARVQMAETLAEERKAARALRGEKDALSEAVATSARAAAAMVLSHTAHEAAVLATAGNELDALREEARTMEGRLRGALVAAEASKQAAVRTALATAEVDIRNALESAEARTTSFAKIAADEMELERQREIAAVQEAVVEAVEDARADAFSEARATHGRHVEALALEHNVRLERSLADATEEAQTLMEKKVRGVRKAFETERDAAVQAVKAVQQVTHHELVEAKAHFEQDKADALDAARSEAALEIACLEETTAAEQQKAVAAVQHIHAQELEALADVAQRLENDGVKAREAAVEEARVVAQEDMKAALDVASKVAQEEMEAAVEEARVVAQEDMDAALSVASKVAQEDLEAAVDEARVVAQEDMEAALGVARREHNIKFKEFSELEQEQTRALVALKESHTVAVLQQHEQDVAALKGTHETDMLRQLSALETLSTSHAEALLAQEQTAEALIETHAEAVSRHARALNELAESHAEDAAQQFRMAEEQDALRQASASQNMEAAISAAKVDATQCMDEAKKAHELELADALQAAASRTAETVGRVWEETEAVKAVALSEALTEASTRADKEHADALEAAQQAAAVTLATEVAKVAEMSNVNDRHVAEIASLVRATETMEKAVLRAQQIAISQTAESVETTARLEAKVAEEHDRIVQEVRATVEEEKHRAITEAVTEAVTESVALVIVEHDAIFASTHATHAQALAEQRTAHEASLETAVATTEEASQASAQALLDNATEQHTREMGAAQALAAELAAERDQWSQEEKRLLEEQHREALTEAVRVAHADGAVQMAKVRADLADWMTRQKLDIEAEARGLTVAAEANRQRSVEAQDAVLEVARCQIADAREHATAELKAAVSAAEVEGKARAAEERDLAVAKAREREGIMRSELKDEHAKAVREAVDRTIDERTQAMKDAVELRDRTVEEDWRKEKHKMKEQARKNKTLITSQHNKVVSELKDAHASAVAAAEGESETRRTKQERRYELAIRSLKARHGETTRTIAAEHEAAVLSLQLEIQSQSLSSSQPAETQSRQSQPTIPPPSNAEVLRATQHNAELIGVLSSARDKLEREKEKRHIATATHQQELDQLKTHHAGAIAVFAEAHKAIAGKLESMQLARQESSSLLKHVHAEHQKLLDRAEAKQHESGVAHEQRIEELTTALEATRVEHLLTKGQQGCGWEDGEQSRKEVALLRAEHAAAVAALKQEAEAHKTSLILEHSCALRRVEMEAATAAETVAVAESVAVAAAEAAAKTEASVEFEAMIGRIRGEHEAALKDAASASAAAVTAVKASAQDHLQSEATAAADRLNKAIVATETSTSDAIDAALAGAEAAYLEKTKTLEEAVQKVLSEAEVEHASVSKQHQEVCEAHAKALDNLRGEMAGELANEVDALRISLQTDEQARIDAAVEEATRLLTLSHAEIVQTFAVGHKAIVVEQDAMRSASQKSAELLEHVRDKYRSAMERESEKRGRAAAAHEEEVHQLNHEYRALAAEAVAGAAAAAEAAAEVSADAVAKAHEEEIRQLKQMDQEHRELAAEAAAGAVVDAMADAVANAASLAESVAEDAATKRKETTEETTELRLHCAAADAEREQLAHVCTLLEDQMAVAGTKALQEIASIRDAGARQIRNLVREIESFQRTTDISCEEVVALQQAAAGHLAVTARLEHRVRTAEHHQREAILKAAGAARGMAAEMAARTGALRSVQLAHEATVSNRDALAHRVGCLEDAVVSADVCLELERGQVCERHARQVRSLVREVEGCYDAAEQSDETVESMRTELHTLSEVLDGERYKQTQLTRTVSAKRLCFVVAAVMRRHRRARMFSAYRTWLEVRYAAVEQDRDEAAAEMIVDHLQEQQDLVERTHAELRDAEAQMQEAASTAASAAASKARHSDLRRLELTVNALLRRMQLRRLVSVWILWVKKTDAAAATQVRHAEGAQAQAYHMGALEQLRSEHAVAMQEQQEVASAGHASALSVLSEEESVVRSRGIADMQHAHAGVLEQLRGAHAAAMGAAHSELSEAMVVQDAAMLDLAAAHAVALAEADESSSHRDALSKAQLEAQLGMQLETLRDAEAQHAHQTMQLRSTLEATVAAATAEKRLLSDRHVLSLREAKVQHDEAHEELQKGHAHALGALEERAARCTNVYEINLAAAVGAASVAAAEMKAQCAAQQEAAQKAAQAAALQVEETLEHHVEQRAAEQEALGAVRSEHAEIILALNAERVATVEALEARMEEETAAYGRELRTREEAAKVHAETADQHRQQLRELLSVNGLRNFMQGLAPSFRQGFLRSSARTGKGKKKSTTPEEEKVEDEGKKGKMVGQEGKKGKDARPNLPDESGGSGWSGEGGWEGEGGDGSGYLDGGSPGSVRFE